MAGCHADAPNNILTADRKLPPPSFPILNTGTRDRRRERGREGKIAGRRAKKGQVIHIS